MTNPNHQALWDKLQHAGLVQGTMPSVTIDHPPWYLRVLQGFTGWIAAWFLLGAFLAIFQAVIEREAVALVLGVGLIAVAFRLFGRDEGNEFIGQFALATSLAGQSLCIYAWNDLLSESTGWWLTAAMAGSLAWLMPSYLHRFLSAYMAIFALTVACMRLPLIWLMPSVVMVAVAILWLTEARWLANSFRWRAIAYALTIAALQMHSMTAFSYEQIIQALSSRHIAEHFWLVKFNEVLLAIVLVVTVVQLLRRYQVNLGSAHGLAAIGGSVVLAFISQYAIGLAVAWTVILLGFANGHRVLLGLGMFAFWAYLARYYYFLQFTLLEKSYVLMATGLLLLMVRWGWQQLTKEHDNA